jgi:hypothetical protein
MACTFDKRSRRGGGGGAGGAEDARDGNGTLAAAPCSVWSGGAHHLLVQLGDVVDRGPHSAAAVACLRACQRAAPPPPPLKRGGGGGGGVVRLAGNHELLWLARRFRHAHSRGDPLRSRARMVASWVEEVLGGQVSTQAWGVWVWGLRVSGGRAGGRWAWGCAWCLGCCAGVCVALRCVRACC